MKLRKIFLKKTVLLLVTHFFMSNEILGSYTQIIPLFIYSADKANIALVEHKLKTLDLQFQIASTPKVNDTELCIIVSDVQNMKPSELPKHYIFYQTERLDNYMSDSVKHIFNNAIAIWDADEVNIQRLASNSIHHYYNLNDYVGRYTGTITLPCFLSQNYMDSYRDILKYSNRFHSDISNHLPVMFCHCILQQPKIIVDDGVRRGDGSTIALKKVNQLLSGCVLIGIDINAESARIYAQIPHSIFLHINDLTFADRFKSMNLVQNNIDFVFIDTSHEYDHTMKEIAMFEFLLSETGAIAFHDTAPSEDAPHGALYGFKDYFGVAFNERDYYHSIISKNGYYWEITHYPYNNGMSVAKRIQKI